MPFEFNVFFIIFIIFYFKPFFILIDQRKLNKITLKLLKFLQYEFASSHQFQTKGENIINQKSEREVECLNWLRMVLDIHSQKTIAYEL